MRRIPAFLAQLSAGHKRVEGPWQPMCAGTLALAKSGAEALALFDGYEVARRIERTARMVVATERRDRCVLHAT